MNRKTLELVVGLFVVAGIAAVGMLAFKVANLSAADLDDGYKVKARFDNIGGLKVRSPVAVAGVRVGRVSDIQFDGKTYQALVVLNIGNQFNTLPKDTGASILTSGLLGENYVGLDPGGSPDHLKDGDELQMTQSALVLEKIISQFLFDKASDSKEKPAR